MADISAIGPQRVKGKSVVKLLSEEGEPCDFLDECSSFCNIHFVLYKTAFIKENLVLSTELIM